jgi:hypothetical protein
VRALLRELGNGDQLATNDFFNIYASIREIQGERFRLTMARLVLHELTKTLGRWFVVLLAAR